MASTPDSKSFPTETAQPRPRRRKTLRCPRCDNRFAASVALGDKIQCPSCQGQLKIRKSKTGPSGAGESPRQAPDNAPVQAPELKKNAPRMAPAHRRGKNLVITVKPLVLAGLLLIAGGGYVIWHMRATEPRVETVQGVVSFDGKPMAVGTIVLRGEDGIFRTGPIHADGTYAITNVPHGVVQVAVIGAETPPEKPAPEEGNEGPAPANDAVPLPENYGDLQRSGISMNLSGETQFDIDLGKTAADAAPESAPQEGTPSLAP